MRKKSRVFSRSLVGSFPRFLMNQHKIKPLILRTAKKKKQVVYGAEAMNVQLPPTFRRQTPDVDLYSKHPRKDAQDMQAKLDSGIAGGRDDYYAKPAVHKGTYRVMFEGVDGQKNTADDVHIADYSKRPNHLNTVTVNGVEYENLKDIQQHKQKTLRNKKAEYRHDKDRSDLARIENGRNVNTLKLLVDREQKKINRLYRKRV